MRFLWRKYHFDAQGCPASFDFDKMLPSGAGGDRQAAVDPDEALEQQERSIAAQSLYAVAHLEPTVAALQGPGAQWGPDRFIGTARLVHLHLELCACCLRAGQLVPSQITLRRTWRKVGCLRLQRQQGQHAHCDTCTGHKKCLGQPLTPSQRAAEIEKYGFHLLDPP